MAAIFGSDRPIILLWTVLGTTFEGGPSTTRQAVIFGEDIDKEIVFNFICNSGQLQNFLCIGQAKVTFTTFYNYAFYYSPFNCRIIPDGAHHFEKPQENALICCRQKRTTKYSKYRQCSIVLSQFYSTHERHLDLCSTIRHLPQRVALEHAPENPVTEHAWWQIQANNHCK